MNFLFTHEDGFRNRLFWHIQLKKKTFYSDEPGHGFELLHSCSWKPSPWQYVPLNAGLGAAQKRALSRVPPSPQVLLQGVQLVHEAQIPSTRKKQTNKQTQKRTKNREREKYEKIMSVLP